MLSRRGLASASALLSAPFILTRAARADAPADTLAKIKSAGKLLAGVRFDFPPVGTVDASGKPIGFGAELAKLFAQKLGVEVEYVQVTSSNRFVLLQNGGIDADIGPTTPTVKREEVVDFSIPYVWDTVVLIVKKDASGDVKAYAPPRHVATTQGSLTADYVKEQVPNADFVYFQEYPDAISALLSGRVDAVSTNGFTAPSFTARSPELKAGVPFFRDPWAISVRPDDSKWRHFLNVTMQELWLKGTYQELYQRTLGAAPDFHMWSEFRLQPGIGASS